MTTFVKPSLLPPPLRRDLNFRALEALNAETSKYAAGLSGAYFAESRLPLQPGRYLLGDNKRIKKFDRGTPATYIDEAGVLRTAPANTPRYEGGKLVVEAASQNLLTRSTNWAASEWWKFDYVLPGATTNMLPDDMELSTNSGSWGAGQNINRVGTTLGPSGLNDAVIYSASTIGFAYLTPSMGVTLQNSNTYKLAVWARLVSGSAPTTGSLAIVDADTNGVPGSERINLPFAGSGLDNKWRRFFLEFTTGTLATAGYYGVYIGADWGNGAQIAFAQPRLVSTQGLPDFANITLNDPIVAAPDGSFTAMKVAVTKAGLFTRQACAHFESGATYTPSLYVYYPSGPARNVYCNDDVTQVAVPLTAATVWQRLQFPAFVRGNGGAFIDFETDIYPEPLWVWGAQLEPGTAMGSFITSRATPESRAPDVVVLAPSEAVTRSLRGKPYLRPIMVYDFDRAETSALPHLAEQFNVLGDLGWELADTEDKKRDYLKEAIALKRLKGTPFAIREIFRLLQLGEVVIQEGRGGKLYDGTYTHDGFVVYDGRWRDWAVYRVIVNVLMTIRMATKARALLERWAPARCHLWGLEAGNGTLIYNAVANYDGAYTHGSY
jgi:Phage tail protein (Tail_P2_I)